MRVRTEGRHAAIVLMKSLQPFEDGLRVMEDQGSGVQLDRAIGPQLVVVPAVGLVPGRVDQVLAENAAEPGVGQDPLSFGTAQAFGSGRDLERDLLANSFHAPTTWPPCSHARPGTKRPSLSTRPRERKEGVFGLGDERQ